MKHLTRGAWLVFALVIAWFAYHRSQQPQALEDCQYYDRLGHGIGCEGPDLGDL